MSELEIRESEEVVLPSGEILDLADVPRCARALVELRDLESKIREYKGLLTDALVAESKRLGSKTIPLPDGSKAEVRGGSRTHYDVTLLEERLRAAGMGDARIDEIIHTEVTRTVVVGEAKRAAGANEDYAEAIAAAATVVEERPSIVIRKV